jgi:uncharacterized membrane protein
MSQAQIERLFQQYPEFSIQEAIRKGWEMFVAQPLNSIAFTMLIFMIQMAAAVYLKDFSVLVSIFVSPALTAGFFLVANRISRGVEVRFSNFFEGFSFWGILIVTSLVSGILTFFGILALILPGIYLGVAFTFAVPFALYSGTNFWTSLELSRRLITLNWWKFFGFVLVLAAFNIIGFVCAIVGLLVTIPVSYFAIYAVFEELTADALAEPEVIRESES